MKYYKSLLTLLLFPFALLILLIGCSSNNSDSATLSISLGDQHRAITRGTAPSNITSITITVKSADMDTISIPLPAGIDIVTFTVTPGSNRLIEAVAAIAPSDPGVVLSYKGSELTNLEPGEFKTVTLVMYPHETKILIPDYLNYRLVQIDSMTGDSTSIDSTWIELLGTTAGFSSNTDFRPYDVDIDSGGRLYIANAYGGSGMGNNRVVRVDNIAGQNLLSFAEASYDGSVVAIAVDRKNDLVYYATNSSIATEKLYRSNLDNSSHTYLVLNNGVEIINRIEGLSVDDKGNLYISGENDSFQARVFKYNPALQTVTHSYSANLNNSSNPLDVMVKNGFVYVTNPSGADGYRILQLSADLSSLVDSYGTDTGTISTVGYFYGGERFVGTVNPYFYIIDEDFGGGSPDRLIYMEDLNGSGWKTYGQNGSSSPGYFNFLSSGT